MLPLYHKLRMESLYIYSSVCYDFIGKYIGFWAAKVRQTDVFCVRNMPLHSFNVSMIECWMKESFWK